MNMGKFFITFFLFQFFLNFNTIFSAPVSKSGEKYLSQSYVDSSIGHAFYILNEATSMSGVGFHQKEAIDKARQVAVNLKRMAKGDPNERYVLWKVGELEAQLYLEEKDLVLQQVQKGKVSVNQLISRYNLEVGKVRPDFSSLKRIHMQISHLDVNKANEMADSYNKRHTAISREVLFSLEKAIMSSNLTKAREELGYCLRNKTYLDIGDFKYSQLENQVEGLIRSSEVKPFIEQDLVEAKSALKQNRLNIARDKIASANNHFSGIKRFLSQSESNSLVSSINFTDRLLKSKEDSLVQVNIKILNINGVQAANDYLKNILRPCGVSRDKAAYVDNTILSISSPDTNSISREIGNIAENEDNTNTNNGLNDLLAAAKMKAQSKMDSIQAIENERQRQLQIEYARNDSILMVSQSQYRKLQDSATSISIQLYTLLESNNSSLASSIFNQNRQFLSKYMWKDAFGILESTLNQTTYPAPVEKVVAVSLVTSQPETAPYTQDQFLKANQNKAQQEIVNLYSMLENNQIREAYDRFNKIKSPLQKYLDKEVFEMLESTVVQSYQSLSW